MIVENFINVRDYVNPSRLPDADFVINPYIGCTHKCLYCYAEFMKRFTGHKEAWGDFLDVKICRKAPSSIKIEGKSIIIGSVTDPYNPNEAKHKITRKILEHLKDAKIKLTIVTKSDLILRDLELLKQFNNINVVVSICTLSEKFRQDMEISAPSIEKRIETLRILHENGIKTTLFISPIFPEITDYKEIVSRTKSFVDVYWFENLNLRGGYKLKILKYIYKNYSDKQDIYDEIYNKNNKEYWGLLRDEINEYCEESGIEYKNYFYHEKIRKNN